MFDEEKRCDDCQGADENKKCDDPNCECEHEHEEDHKSKNEKKKSKKEFVSKEEFDKMQDQYLKALNTAAHHENLSKYYRGEYEKMMKYRSQALLEAILPSLDGFQLAFKYDAPTKEAQNYRLGFEFVYKLLISALNSEGMIEIKPTLGTHYDALTCQVVDTVETTEEAKVGQVTEVLLSGYRFKDRIVRPANVMIYTLKKVEEKQTSTSDNENKETSEEIKN